MTAVDIELVPCDIDSAETFAHLDSLAFPSSPGTIAERTDELLHDPRCPVDRYFFARIDDTIIGGFRILPLKMRVAPTRWIQVGGLGRIGIYPHYRRLGYADGVMRLILQASYNQGDVLSLLYPSSFKVYRKFGYGIAARHMLYSVPPRAFPDDRGRAHIRPAKVDDWEDINRCYENQIHSEHGIVQRSERSWREYYLNRSIDEGYSQWVYEDEDGVSGFVSCWYEPTDKFYTQRLHVTEWFASKASALRACLGFFRAHSANIEVIQLPCPVGYALEVALEEPVYSADPDLTPWHQPIGKLCSTLMGRIVRIHEAMAARAFAHDGSVNLLVDDWSLPENSGYYSLTVRNGHGELSPAVEGYSDIRVDISVLSSLYCGAMTAQQGRLYGLVESSPEAAGLLDRMFGDTRYMVWDYF